MRTKVTQKDNAKEQLKYKNTKNKFKEIKSDFFLKILFNCIIPKRILLETIKYNKYMQKIININISNYKDYSENYSSIHIELVPKKNKYGIFINITEEDMDFYHIYFNNNKKEEIKRNYLNENDNVSKINIIADHQIKSFNKLFYNCKCIEFINFRQFFRNNITDMSFMFYKCSSLKELNTINFNTNNVTNMCGMFSWCSSLKELNLINFNTNNVTDMSHMFVECSSLKEINLSNFNTNKVTNMSYMFYGCLDELRMKIKNQCKNFMREAFW